MEEDLLHFMRESGILEEHTEGKDELVYVEGKYVPLLEAEKDYHEKRQGRVFPERYSTIAYKRLLKQIHEENTKKHQTVKVLSIWVTRENAERDYTQLRIGTTYPEKFSVNAYKNILVERARARDEAKRHLDRLGN